MMVEERDAFLLADVLRCFGWLQVHYATISCRIGTSLAGAIVDAFVPVFPLFVVNTHTYIY